MEQQFQVLTTELYRLAKQRNKEKVETLAQQLHAKARVVDTLVDDHRRINQDLQDIQGALAVSRQEHQNVARNLDAIVQHVNTKMAALGDAVVAAGKAAEGGGSGNGNGAGGGSGGSDVSDAAAAADAAAARDLLSQLVQTQQEQARNTAGVAQREARKSAILFSAVVQMGQLLDRMRADVGLQISALNSKLNRSLPTAGTDNEAAAAAQEAGAGDNGPSSAALRAASVREMGQLEQRVNNNIRQAANETVARAAGERREALEEFKRRTTEDRKLLSNVGVEAQKLKIQLQLESQQRRALEADHKQWLAQLRDGLVASGEEAGGRIAAVLAQVDQAAAATRAEAQRAVDEQREQLLAELERRAVELRTVESTLNSSVREVEDRLVDKIAERQSAAEANAQKLVQRCDSLEEEVRTITDAVSRSLSGLKANHSSRLGELEKVLKAEINARQADSGTTKARLEGVVASITRAIDAVQENTADDLRELDERIAQTASALSMNSQQDRQEMQREIDSDLDAVFKRLDGVEEVVAGLTESAEAADEDAAQQAVQDVMERLVMGVELAAAEETSTELRAAVGDLEAELEAEKRRRKDLEAKVDELLERGRTKQADDDTDWKDTVGAAMAWLREAAARREGSDDPDGKEEDTKTNPAGEEASDKAPKVRVRADIFAE